jgi:hypothetical protein
MITRVSVAWQLFVAAMVIVTASFTVALTIIPPPITQMQRVVLTPYVRQGELVVFRNSWILDKSCAFTIYRTVYDSRNQIIFSSSEHRPKEFQPANKLIERLLVIPIAPVANPGTARYESESGWECNLFQTWFQPRIKNQAVTFEIILARQPQKWSREHGSQ